MTDTRERPTSTAGARLFRLITGQSEWIHRRVDRTDLDADGETTRRMSFDLTISDALRIDHGGGVVVPLTVMTKVPLRRLDAVGPDLNPVPVLGRADNSDLVADMLVEAFRGVAVGPFSSAVESAVRSAVREDDPERMPHQVAALAAAVAEQPTGDPDQVAAVLALATDLVHQFMFAVLLPTSVVGRRVVVKVAVSEGVTRQFRGWSFSGDGRSMDLPLTLQDSAASAHFEFRAPLGLRVASVRLLDDSGSEIAPRAPCVRTGRTAHLTGLDRLTPEDGGGVRARVELGPVADGLVRQTAWATGFVALLFLLAAVGSDRLQDALAANRAGPVAAAALAVPALFLSVQARRQEHSWVARALFVPRFLNIATAALLYASAVYLVTTPAASTALEAVMWGAFALQLAPFAVALVLLRTVSDHRTGAERPAEYDER